jgi:hypothetical protein
MSFSDIRKMKKVDEKETQTISCQYVVVGNDLFSLATYKELCEKLGQDNVALLTSAEISVDASSFKGPNLLRGQENIAIVKEDRPDTLIQKTETIPSFYKDMKFRHFGGRSKSETLLWGEEFFTAPHAQYKLEDLFPFLNDEQFFKQTADNAITSIPLHIERMQGDKNWQIECTNGSLIQCKEIYWGESPSDFLELYKVKSELSSNFIQFCEGTQTPCALHIKLIFEKRITEMTETLFIPLSYTHEWGHFLGEFEPVDNENSSQKVEFVTYVDKNETSEEEVSKKIRILKRNLEKIFPYSKDISVEEFLALLPQSQSLKIDDQIFYEDENKVGNLSFISFNAPISLSEQEKTLFGDSCGDVSHLARAVRAHTQFKQDLHS